MHKINNNFFIKVNQSIKLAIKHINISGHKCLLVIDNNKKFLGTISDGDIRKYLIKNDNLNENIKKLYNKKPIFLNESDIDEKKIKSFFINNKKTLTIALSLVILIIFGYFIYEDLKKKNKIKLANKYNLAIIEFVSGDKIKVENELIDIVNKKDKTYSPLALYFLIDNNIINENNKINELFDIVINETSLEKEIKNLVIYKKALFNSDFESENNLIQILNPVINSDSAWKSHALYLMAEYFYYKNQRQKSKEFFNKILTLENSNQNIKIESQKRLNRDFSD